MTTKIASDSRWRLRRDENVARLCPQMRVASSERHMALAL